METQESNPQAQSESGRHNAARRMRPFSLYEALPYSPHTSVVPFLPDLLPDSSIGSGSVAPRLSDIFDSALFQSYNAEAISGQSHNSRQLRHAVESVMGELRPNMKANYKFHSFQRSHTIPKPAMKISSNLGALSKSVFEKVGVYFMRSGSDAACSITVNGGHGEKQVNGKQSALETKTGQSTLNNVAVNSQAHNQNQTLASIEVATQSYQVPEENNIAQKTVPAPAPSRKSQASASPLVSQGPPNPASATPIQPTKVLKTSDSPAQVRSGAITIELPAPNFDPNEYTEVADIPDTPPNLSSRKRKREGYADSQEILGHSLDQHQRGEAALRELELLTQQIFEAAHKASANDSTGLVILTNNQEPSMTMEAHQKLHGLIQKSISLKCFGAIPLQDLLHYQKLCENTLRHCDRLDYQLRESWSEAEVQSWAEQLIDVEHGLKAARTALRTMSGGREDRQLYSEGIIQQCLDVLKNTLNGITVPVVELRTIGTSATLFKLLGPHKKAIKQIFIGCQRLFALMTELAGTIEISETVLNSLEFASSRLMFVENAPSEKESVMGIQQFDGLRSMAMDMLCQIFVIKPQQRQGIFSDIMTSLEKLPVGRQSARQFKTSDGASIQPVSALIMRLIQSSAGHVEGRTYRKGGLQSDGDNDTDGEADEIVAPKEVRKKPVSGIKDEYEAAAQHDVAVKSMENVAWHLCENAKRNASFVVGFIVNRALKSTKTGDTPYRNLLDQFVEDFTTCLESPDWPAAETFLRLLMFAMVRLSEGDKTPAPAKNMALELLGTIGAAISKVRSHVRKTANAVSSSCSDDLGRYLSDFAHSSLEKKAQPQRLVDWSGPYRVTVEYLESRVTDDPYLTSGISFLEADWANMVSSAYGEVENDDDGRDKEYGRLAFRLKMMIENRNWLSNEYTFKSAPVSHVKLAYMTILLNSPLCDAFGIVMTIVVRSMTSDQATVRSKSLKSVNQILEIDPSILDGDSIVVQKIFQCSADTSTQVRDSALGLIGKCIAVRPALEQQMIPTVIERFTDAGVGVRKRAMKLARDIYLGNRDKAVRSTIANGLLHRVQDPDEGVRDLSRQMIEEIWFAPFYSTEKNAASETALTEHVSLIIQTVKYGNVTAILDKILHSILGSQGKAPSGPFAVCTRLVANMFDLINMLDSDDPLVPSGRDVLQVLTIFAKADAKLFTFEQIKLLKPHLEGYRQPEELLVFKAVAVIYRRVLPQLSAAIYSEFLSEVRQQLLQGVGRMSRAILDDVIACVWITCGHLKSPVPLARVAASSLKALGAFRHGQANENAQKKLIRYMELTGMVGKHCQLDGEADIFKRPEFFPHWKGTSVARFIIDSTIGFAAPSQPQKVRKAAIDAIGLVCQSSPRNYVLPNVYTTFQQVFDERDMILEHMVLGSFREFLFIEEQRSESATDETQATKNDGKKKRELTVMGGTSYDDVASATTQRFLNEFTRIALATQDEHALLATEILASINRQGLVHPKETIVTFLTLESSLNARISELALQGHRMLHEKHETVLEREYAKAFQSVYNYQKDVVKDVRGASTDPFQPKLYLMMEVLKISKSKNRQRFLDKLCSQIEFDPAKLDMSVPDAEALPPHAQYTRFIVENLAYIDYVTVGEIHFAINFLEKLVTSIGTGVAHAIESELLNVTMEVDPQAGPEQSQVQQPWDNAEKVATMGLPGMVAGSEEAATTIVVAEGQAAIAALPSSIPPVPPVPPVDPDQLRRLATCAVILLAVWEVRTYLRRLYGMGVNRRDTKVKAQAKDLAKSPVKVQGIHGDKIWDELGTIMAGLKTPDLMMQRCRQLVELMSIDQEFKVQDNDEDLEMEGPVTPSDGEGGGGDADTTPGDRGRKRKANTTPGGRNKKRARSTSKPRPRGRPRKNPVPDKNEGGKSDEMTWM